MFEVEDGIKLGYTMTEEKVNFLFVKEDYCTKLFGLETPIYYIITRKNERKRRRQ